jgi:hypothetical protein
MLRLRPSQAQSPEHAGSYGVFHPLAHACAPDDAPTDRERSTIDVGSARAPIVNERPRLLRATKALPRRATRGGDRPRAVPAVERVCETSYATAFMRAFRTACAAASLATGTRYGEQLT